MSFSPTFSRRSLLHGSMYGATIAIGLPILDCFLDNSGRAFAATSGGSPLPIRFGTWFWGCGLTPNRWEPGAVGRNWEISPELKPLEAFKTKLNVLSGFNVILDGAAPFPHYTGQMAVLSGSAPEKNGETAAPTIDTIIAETIGKGRRFRSIEATSAGNPAYSYSARSSSDINPPMVSPMALYARLFGNGFVDPNTTDWKPDCFAITRRSVLSAVYDQRRALMSEVGASDRARLDQYFTSVREIENQLSLQLEKPARNKMCKMPETPIGTEIDIIMQNHKLMVGLIAMGMACDQSAVFNMVFSNGFSGLRETGTSDNHHQLTHEEPIDERLGYQPKTAFFVQKSMEAFGELLMVLDSIKEGDVTLLDNSVVMGVTDTGFAKIHQLENVPLLLAGSGGGRLRTGVHVAGNGDAVTRLGLSVQQALDIPVGQWGDGPLATHKTITEIIA